MQAGKLRHHVIIEALVANMATIRDVHGGLVETWAPFAESWASIEPIRAVEIFRAGQVDARITHRVTMRYQSGIETAMRILFGTRVFLLLSVANPDERGIMLEMLAMEAR